MSDTKSADDIAEELARHAANMQDGELICRPSFYAGYLEAYHSRDAEVAELVEALEFYAQNDLRDISGDLTETATKALAKHRAKNEGES